MSYILLFFIGNALHLPFWYWILWGIGAIAKMLWYGINVGNFIQSNEEMGYEENK